MIGHLCYRIDACKRLELVLRNNTYECVDKAMGVCEHQTGVSRHVLVCSHKKKSSTVHIGELKCSLSKEKGFQVYPLLSQ